MLCLGVFMFVFLLRIQSNLSCHILLYLAIIGASGEQVALDEYLTLDQKYSSHCGNHALWEYFVFLSPENQDYS